MDENMRETTKKNKITKNFLFKKKNNNRYIDQYQDYNYLGI